MIQCKTETLENWSIAEGFYDDFPIIIRYRVNLDSPEIVNCLPHLITIRWSLKTPTSEMLPGSSEKEELDEFEDNLLEVLSINDHSLLSIVITNSGFRSWYIYINDLDMFSEALSALPQKKEKYPIEILLDRNDNWSFYKGTLANMTA
jgi:Family of unknown function (DUF695)